MSEANWALLENGAQVADASFEASHASSSATNLLRAREDELWITGDAPQHVTLRLSATHPPLHFAGWHVWHDYLTNPQMVEISSGPSLEQLVPLLVCQALPGAGTQVWKLPKPIPSEHRFVRFRIAETFGAGPTYMNTIVLLEKDPGPDYDANGESAAAAARAAPANAAAPTSARSRGTPDIRLTSPISASSPYISRPASVPNAGGSSGFEKSPPPRKITPPTGPPLTPAGMNMSATPRGFHQSDDGGRSDVGVFFTSGGGGVGTSPTSRYDGRSRSAGAGLRSPAGVRSNSRMSQLLRDLDDDIKLLKPIRTASPGRNMLMCLPQEPAGLPIEDGNDDDDDGEEEERSAARALARTTKSPAPENKRRGPSPAREGRSHHRHHSRHSSEGRRHRSSRRQEEGDKGRSPSHAGRLEIVAYPAAAQPSPSSSPIPPHTTACVNASYEARLGALEQAVAALNEAVQHQRDDLAMIKRVLLQQAAERRKEVELRLAEQRRQQEREEKRSRTSATMMAMMTAPPPPPPTPPAAVVSPLPASASHTTTTTIIQAAPADQRLTHRSITVDFPEDALRAFVESVLEQRLRTHTKKVEAKLLHRLDKQLHGVVKVLSATVEGRLTGVANATAAAAAAASSPLFMSTPRAYSESSVGAQRRASDAGVPADSYATERSHKSTRSVSSPYMDVRLTPHVYRSGPAAESASAAAAPPPGVTLAREHSFEKSPRSADVRSAAASSRKVR